MDERLKKQYENEFQTTTNHTLKSEARRIRLRVYTNHKRPVSHEAKRIRRMNLVRK